MRLPLTLLSDQEVLNTALHETKNALVTTEDEEQYSHYACKTVTVAAAQTDYDVKAQNPTLFATTYKLVSVYAKDAPVTIKLYTDVDDEILLDAGEQMTFSNSQIGNIFVTTTVEANIRFFMQG